MVQDESADLGASDAGRDLPRHVAGAPVPSQSPDGMLHNLAVYSGERADPTFPQKHKGCQSHQTRASFSKIRKA